MKLKVTIEKDGTAFSSDTMECDEGLAPFFAVGLAQSALVASELMHQEDRLEVLGSEEDSLLDKAGY